MAPRIVILTGAGISAESGIPTFRDGNGLWNDHRVEDVASPEGFARDPDLVHAFYDRRRRDAASVHPNPAHYALAELEQQLSPRGDRDGVLIVTQNVDDLHERAGSRNVIHMHGELNSARCVDCGARHPWHDDLADRPPCPACGQAALRPDIVWFGELVYRLDEIEEAVDGCETLIVVGTSATVWPAAGLAARARARGVETILVNLDAHDDLLDFGDVRLGPASAVVPELVAEILDEDYDPDSDWSESSPALLRTSVYIDIETLVDGHFFSDGKVPVPGRLPRLRRGARDAVTDLARDFDVVLVADAELADSSEFPLFWRWYQTHFGSVRGHLVDQLLLNGDPQAMRGWDYFVVGDDLEPAEWIGHVLRFGADGLDDWDAVTRHVWNRALGHDTAAGDKP